MKLSEQFAQTMSIDVLAAADDAVIATYLSIAEALPSEWPSHLEHLRTRTDTHAAIALVEDLDDVALVSQLWAHDQAQASIRSNMVERAKSQAILDALIAQQSQA